MSRPRSVTVLGPAECGRLAADLRQMAPVREYNWQRILKVHCSVGAPPLGPPPPQREWWVILFVLAGAMSGELWCIMVQLWCKKSTFFLSENRHWYPLDHISCVINIVCDIIMYKISLEFEYYWSDELSQNLSLKARHSYSSKYQVSPNSYYVVPCAMMTILHTYS